MAKKKTEGEAAAPRVPAEEFVSTWQGCATLAEAKEKLGKYASARATRLRAAGVALKEMPAAPRIDVDALNKLAKASLKEAKKAAA